MSKLQQIPRVSALNHDLVNAVMAITNNVEVGAGVKGDGLDRWVKVRDLVGIDVARLNGVGRLIAPPGPASADLTPPSVLTGLVVSGGFASIFLQWNASNDSLHSFTEIWRSSTNDLGVAVKTGTSTGVLYADSIGTGAARYYWIRSISVNGIPGPFNTAPNAGTLGRTSYDHSYVIRALTISWKQGVYAANSYVIPSPASETGLWYKTTLGGTTGTTEPTAWPTVVGNTVVDGGVTWTAVNASTVNAPFLIGDVAGSPAVVMSTVYVADASIESAKIKTLVADKIAAGTIAVAVELTAATVTGGLVRTSSGTGWRTEISGASGDFPLWYGIGAKSEANGRFYVKNGGGLAMRDHDGSVIFETFPASAMVQIKNASIESLAAGKVTAGTITAAIELTAAIVTGGLVRTSSGTGWRTEISGASGDFPLWYGIGAKSEANGRFYVKNGGGVAMRDHDGAVIFETFPGSAMTQIKNVSIESLAAGKVTAGAFAAAFTLTGSLEVSAAGYLRSGQTAFDTGTGYWIDNNSGSPRFSLGNSAGNKLTWDTAAAALNIVGDINSGSTIRGANLMGSAFMTKGSFLTTAAAAAATTLNIKDTSDFPASGSGTIIDTTNDNDAIAWTGKTATTLTGCSGVLAHNNSAIVVPAIKAIIIDDATSEIRFFGDRGDGVIDHLASVGISPYETDYVIGDFGNSIAGNTRTGVRARSNSSTALAAESKTGNAIYAGNDSTNQSTIRAVNVYPGTTAPLIDAIGTTAAGIAIGKFHNEGGDGVYGTSATTGSGVSGYGQGNGYGVLAGCGTSGRAPLRILPSTLSAAPSNTAGKGSLRVSSLGKIYINKDDGTTWARILDDASPTITFGSQAMAESTSWTPARGDYNFLVTINDSAGNVAVISIDIYDSGAALWRTTIVARGEDTDTAAIEKNQWAGRLYCDGSNMRFTKNLSATATTIFYQKFD